MQQVELAALEDQERTFLCPKIPGGEAHQANADPFPLPGCSLVFEKIFPRMLLSCPVRRSEYQGA